MAVIGRFQLVRYALVRRGEEGVMMKDMEEHILPWASGLVWYAALNP